jgi:transposase InsO family protein
MAWRECSVADQRKLIVAMARVPETNRAELARRFGVSRKTLYKWLKRCDDAGSVLDEWASDRSRRPKSCPWQTCANMEQMVDDVRVSDEGKCWGPRKIRRVLVDRGVDNVPAPSTVGAILRRRGRVSQEESLKHRVYTRFERDEPNELWQMDFKGPFSVRNRRCHPLTIVDDHSRFALAVEALPGETAELTRPALINVFRRYGLPQCMLLDNGSCWGRVGAIHTHFTAWLLRLGILVTYSRPYHPQTKGKNERFNRTLKAEAITGRNFSSLDQCQQQFDRFLTTYNTIRPHEALAMAVPASRYVVSKRSYPEHLPQIEYLEHDIIRQVGAAGYISFHKQRFQVGRAFSGDPVALRPTCTDGVFEVYYCYQRIAVIDQRDESCRQT